MKRTLAILGQFIVMVLAAFTGMLFLARLLPQLHIVHIIGQQGFTRRQYEFDWLFSVAFAYILFLLVGLAFKSRRTNWVATTIAFVLTVALLALFTKIGFKDANLLYGS